MDDLTYALLTLCHRNRDGSHTTQADRRRTLTLISRQLKDAGFGRVTAAHSRESTSRRFSGAG